MQTIDSTSPASEITRRLRRVILSRTVATGDQFPPERQLAEAFGVSRGSVRDALRTLQAEGLVTVRVGAKGGTFVTKPPPGLIAERITHMLALDDLSPAQVTEARAVLELGAIPLACRRAQEADLRELEALTDRAEVALREGEHDFHHSVAFHVALARASHSPATAIIIDALHEPVLRSMIRAAAKAPHMAEQGIAEHRQLIDALRRRDEREAQEILALHLRRLLERIDGDTTILPSFDT
ncbi:FadR/GntR family transcriptional regulator [Egicoccus sp. AB-alg2]|uniref:FadR/GntR family transcriptional regulator n=1 Tax=Egicoccus sp. AB-alg2 TaxID=3242693 RepID=UPI00359D0DB9